MSAVFLVFSCEYKDGFEIDGFSCSDIDECISNPCDQNAICDNTIGSYDCACFDGFDGDGMTCETTTTTTTITTTTTTTTTTATTITTTTTTMHPIGDPAIFVMVQQPILLNLATGSYDENSYFQTHQSARFFNCGMMLNGEFIIFRQETVSTRE